MKQRDYGEGKGRENMKRLRKVREKEEKVEVESLYTEGKVQKEKRKYK